MKIRTSIAAAGAAVVLGGTVLAGTGALALPAIASTPSATHTLTFTSVTANAVSFTATTEGLQDTDHNSAGKTIGFDDLVLTFTGRTTAKGDVAIAVKGGFLYGTIATANAGQTFSGKVTGGTGAFAKATGKITAKAITGQKTAVTVTYRT
jgi:hypothetical protein